MENLENSDKNELNDLLESQLKLDSNEHNDFIKYLGENKSEDAEEKTLKALVVHGFPVLGDLFSTERMEIAKTLHCIRLMMEQLLDGNSRKLKLQEQVSTSRRCNGFKAKKIWQTRKLPLSPSKLIP
jgi:hypothetical protein